MEGLPLPAGPAGAPGDVHRRPRRDDLRDAPGAVPGPGGHPVPRGPEVVGLLFSAVSVGALIGALTSGWVSGSAARVSRCSSRWRSGGSAIVGFGLSGRNLRGPGVRLSRGRGRGRRGLRGVPSHDPPAQRARRPARPALARSTSLVVAGGPRIGDVEAGIVGRARSPVDRGRDRGGVLCLRRVSSRPRVAVPFPSFARGGERGRAALESVRR